jgi:hypothetical protein
VTIFSSKFLLLGFFIFTHRTQICDKTISKIEKKNSKKENNFKLWINLQVMRSRACVKRKRKVNPKTSFVGSIKTQKPSFFLLYLDRPISGHWEEEWNSFKSVFFFHRFGKLDLILFLGYFVYMYFTAKKYIKI